MKKKTKEMQKESEVDDARERKKRALDSFNQQIQNAKRIDDRNKKREQEKRERDKQRQTQTENAPSLAVLKKKIKSGTKLGSTETSSAKARGLIPRADGTKRKSPKYK